MASNAETTIQQVRHEVEALLAYVTGPETRTQSAYSVELTLFRRLLALGATLLQLFFLSRAAVRPATPRLTMQGPLLPYHDQRRVSYYSVFGKLSFSRHYFYAAGVGGCCPLDAELSLSTCCYSDLLREWCGYDCTDGAYRETATTIKHILGLKLSVQALQMMVREDAGDVTAFYEQLPDLPQSGILDSILVVQADGKGIPMVQPTTEQPVVRLGKGQKRSKKKEATVTSLYTIAPYVRTPQQVLAALLREPQEPTPRPHPVNKELRATLEGKEVAIRRLQERAVARQGLQIQDRVALTDGAEALQQQMHNHFPHYTLVLDIIHASEYLWDSANALLGERHPARTSWVRSQLEQILQGNTETVIATLEQAANEPGQNATQLQALHKTIGYYRRNLPYMHYDEYLARGWPIGTGVVEGACGHLVKDRMEQAGMRWTQDGAQAVLDLRAVRLNGDWEAYWQFHRERQHERCYGSSTPMPATVETQVLQLAA